MSFMALLGNPSLTGMVTTFDSEIAIDVYTDIQSGALVNNILSREQRTAMDVNKDGIYDDSTFIRTYIAYLYNEGSMSYEDWVNAGKPRYDS